MTAQFFRATVNLDALPLGHLAEVSGALATLERLGQAGVLLFESGRVRGAYVLPANIGKREKSTRLADIITEALAGGELSFPALMDATGLPDGSISATLSGLVRAGRVVRTRLPRADGVPLRGRTFYKLSEEPT